MWPAWIFCANENGTCTFTGTRQVDGRTVHEIALGYFETRTEAEAARLEAANIAFGRLNLVADLMTHPQLRTMLQPTPSGDVEVIAPAIRISGPAAPPRPVPALGQHTQLIRREFA